MSAPEHTNCSDALSNDSLQTEDEVVTPTLPTVGLPNEDDSSALKVDLNSLDMAPMGTPLPVKHERTTRASDSFDLEHEQTLQASQFGTTSPPSTTTNSLGPKPESTLIDPKCFERPATGTLRPLLGDYLSRFILVPEDCVREPVVRIPQADGSPDLLLVPVNHTPLASTQAWLDGLGNPDADTSLEMDTEAGHPVIPNDGRLSPTSGSFAEHDSGSLPNLHGDGPDRLYEGSTPSITASGFIDQWRTNQDMKD